MTYKKTSAQAKQRRRNALERLTAQEKSGLKTAKKSVTEKVALTELDSKRIKREKEVLASRT